MFESTVSFLMTEQLGGASFEPPLGPTGYDRLLAPNRRPFRTGDGYMAILPYTTSHWTAFFELIGRPELAHSPQVQDPVVRSRDVDSLYAVIAAVAPTRTSAEWQADLRRLDIPCARVNAVGDLLQDEHLRATGFFREYEHPTEGHLRDARSPFRLHGAPEQADRPTPRTGADGREILASIGYNDAEIERLAAQRIVALAE
jgi:crotonobetainyl-CoA:carnitine CoA-transferase CaiB-like acyl-CoA transferase